MNGSVKTMAFALVAGLTATAAAAQDKPIGERYNYYVSGAGGINLMHGDDEVLINGGTVTTVTQGVTEFDGDLGWAAAGALGMFLSNGFRVEVEGAYRENDFDASTFTVVDVIGPLTWTGAHGTVSGWSAMVNVLKDFPNDSRLTPYIGGGAGASGRQLELVCGTSTGVAPGFESMWCGAEDSQTSFAYQAIAGLSLDLTERLQVFADYRFFAVNNHQYFNDVTSSGVRDFDDRNHTIMAGLRLAFGEKAAPAPVAAPQPKNYLVFFDFDRSDLTSDGQQVVATAAKDAIDGKAVSLDVVGHADRSGTDEYNLGLSERRANTVKGELVRLGVPESAIQISWKGESEPLVATEDGVREAQNRRASITINFPQ
jgi:outer membrane protein OmpA-like peptidoglycan-associated protein